MTQYDDNNTGVLFPNDRKTSDKAPDFTGSITVDGKKQQLAAWKRESKAGKKFLSIKVSEFQKKDEPKAYADRRNPDLRNGSAPDLDDEIPF